MELVEEPTDGTEQAYAEAFTEAVPLFKILDDWMSKGSPAPRAWVWTPTLHAAVRDNVRVSKIDEDTLCVEIRRGDYAARERLQEHITALHKRLGHPFGDRDDFSVMLDTATEDLTFDTLLTAWVELVQHEIKVDIIRGKVPETVKSFSELHDYVDANTYGGLCMDGAIQRLGGLDNAVGLANKMQEKVDAWLKAGRP
jgi:hypothetical protein